MRDLIAIGASVCIAVAGAAFGAPPVVVVVPHVPTPRGSIRLEMEREGDVWRVAVETPCSVEFAFMDRTASLRPGKSELTVRALQYISSPQQRSLE